jgi:hypothetical protein
VKRDSELVAVGVLPDLAVDYQRDTCGPEAFLNLIDGYRPAVRRFQ